MFSPTFVSDEPWHLHSLETMMLNRQNHLPMQFCVGNLQQCNPNEFYDPILDSNYFSVNDERKITWGPFNRAK